MYWRAVEHTRGTFIQPERTGSIPGGDRAVPDGGEQRAATVSQP
jgi:hypothetical protein